MTLLKISDFANRHNITRRTLLYYDQIGLLHPFKIDENGYRYYASHQSMELTTILTLKELGAPLDKIKMIIKKRNPDMLDDIYLELSTKIDAHIAELTKVQYALTSRLEKNIFLNSIVLNSPEVAEGIHEIYACTLITKDYPETVFQEKQQAFIHDDLLYDLLDLPTIIDGEPWGYILKNQGTANKQFRPTTLIKRICKHTAIKQLPKENKLTLTGDFLSTYTLNEPDFIKKAITQLFNYSKQHHLSLLIDTLYVLVWKDEVETPHLSEHILEVSFFIKKD